LSDNIKEIVKFEPIIGEAVDMFNTVSKDPKTQELMRMREEGERNYISAMLCAEQRGIQLGKQEGIQLGKQEGIQLGKQEGIQLGKQEGIQLGKQEGIQLGERRSRIETARTMITENIPLETVAKCTGLSMSELKTLE
jgi:flagellar biosynthesis/type III secretory pathway protein FliH